MNEETKTTEIVTGQTQISESLNVPQDTASDKLQPIDALQLSIERLKGMKFDLFHQDALRTQLNISISLLLEVLKDQENRIETLERDLLH